MKFSTKRGQFEASNVSYNATSKSAFSYHWWQFVRVIDGLVVFNGYRYSITTARHQSKVKKLMSELGHKADRWVSIPESLSEVNDLNALAIYQDLQNRHEQMVNEKKRLERNRKARERRANKSA